MSLLKRLGRVLIPVAVALVAGSHGAGSLHAQTRYEIAPGTAVRLTVRGATPRIEGRLVRLDADSVVVAAERHAHVAALDRLLSIENRYRRGRGWGALRGLGWGAAIGGIVGAVTGGINSGDDPGGSALFVAVLMGAFGGGFGAAIGAAWPGERWVEAPTVHSERSQDESVP
jgi:hypothetical protein